MENAASQRPGGNPELENRHERLKASVSEALGELDALIRGQQR